MRILYLMLVLFPGGAAASGWDVGLVQTDPMLIWLAGAVGAVGLAILIVLLRRRGGRHYIVVDGSNVMHWRNAGATLETVDAVLRALQDMGYVPVVWFDANVGYKVGHHYMGPRMLSRFLNLPQRQVFVAPSGTPADPLLLNAAQVLNARVVSNDRFRDWAESHPQTTQAGFLVPGKIRRTGVVLDGIELAGAKHAR